MTRKVDGCRSQWLRAIGFLQVAVGIHRGYVGCRSGLYMVYIRHCRFWAPDVFKNTHTSRVWQKLCKLNMVGFGAPIFRLSTTNGCLWSAVCVRGREFALLTLGQRQDEHATTVLSPFTMGAVNHAQKLFARYPASSVTQ